MRGRTDEVDDERDWEIERRLERDTEVERDFLRRDYRRRIAVMYGEHPDYDTREELRMDRLPRRTAGVLQPPVKVAH